MRDLIKQYLKDVINDAKEYERSGNVGESLEGRSQRVEAKTGKETGVENNEQTANRSEDSGILSDVIERFINSTDTSRP